MLIDLGQVNKELDVLLKKFGIATDNESFSDAVVSTLKHLRKHALMDAISQVMAPM